MFHLAPGGEASRIVNDPGASDGKALRMTGPRGWAEDRFDVPGELEGRWWVFVVTRCECKAETSDAIAIGVCWEGDTIELARLIAGCAPDENEAYRTFDLGVHELRDGSQIWVRPGDDDAVEAVYVDRLFLVAS